MSGHYHYDYAYSNHDHGGYASEYHDHGNDYAEKYHRHYDDERTADQLRQDLSAAEKWIRELADDLRDALNRIRVLEDAEYVRQHGNDDLETGDIRDPEGDEAAHG